MITYKSWSAEVTVEGKRGERGRVWGLLSSESRVLMGSLFICEFKTEERELKAREEGGKKKTKPKHQQFKGQISKSARCLKQKSLAWRGRQRTLLVL